MFTAKIKNSKASLVISDKSRSSNNILHVLINRTCCDDEHKALLKRVSSYESKQAP